jgi:hypothetical protein
MSQWSDKKREATMKTLVLGLFASVGLLTAGSAANAESQLMAPVHQFIDNFNKGDVKMAAAAFAPTSIAIIDEVGPHVWIGPNALGDWAHDLAAHDQAGGVSGQAVTLGEPTREIISGDKGYLVVSVVYSFKQQGAAMREPAQMTYALTKAPGGSWLITGWSWVGTAPVAAP